MIPFLAGAYGNPSGGHAAARRAKAALEEAREEVAALLGAEPGEVVFTAGGTEADNLAVKGAARAARAGSGADGVVTTAFEDTLNALGLVDRQDPAVTLVAKRMIELARGGERDPILLRDEVLKALRSRPDTSGL